MSTVIIIPSRIASTRLKNKALALIEEKPMIEWVYGQAMKSKVGDVYVAACCDEIASVIKSIGGKVILTDPDIPSGTDRVYHALKTLPNQYDKIINLQGDIPFIDPNHIKAVCDTFQPDSDITSICAPIEDPEEAGRPSVVKPVLSFINEDLAKALYFSRSPVPYNAKTYYHHIGVYGYRASALKRFVECKPSSLEQAENLEQLRALENNMIIHMGIVKNAPIAVDTMQDLEDARHHAKQTKTFSL